MVSTIKTAEAICESGHKWIGIIKTSYILFPKQELENMLMT
jgi:hypothetical protein